MSSTQERGRRTYTSVSLVRLHAIVYHVPFDRALDVCMSLIDAVWSNIKDNDVAICVDFDLIQYLNKHGVNIPPVLFPPYFAHPWRLLFRFAPLTSLLARPLWHSRRGRKNMTWVFLDMEDHLCVEWTRLYVTMHSSSGVRRCLSLRQTWRFFRQTRRFFIQTWRFFAESRFFIQVSGGLLIRYRGHRENSHVPEESRMMLLLGYKQLSGNRSFSGSFF